MKKYHVLIMVMLFLLTACSQVVDVTASHEPLTPPTEMAIAATKSPEPKPTEVPPTKLPPTELPELQLLDLPYTPDGRGFQVLDVYLPATGEGPFPTILAIHGGSFRYRSKSMYRHFAEHFTALGYAFVSTNYRSSMIASYPAQVEDVFCALAWIHANNDVYGFDPENTFVMGGSAGGYLAAMVGTVDSPSSYLENCPHPLPDKDYVQGMVIFYGFYDFTSIDGFNDEDVTIFLPTFWGAEYDEIPPETLAEMSPMSWVDGSEPPTLLIHGTTDGNIPSWMSEEFATALADAGVDVELLLIDAGHAFELKPISSPEMQQSLEAIEPFLSALLEQ